jgi:hypothetical protein
MFFRPYTRFNKTEGNFAIDKKNLTPEIIEKIIKIRFNCRKYSFNHYQNIRKCIELILVKTWTSLQWNYRQLEKNPY